MGGFRVELLRLFSLIQFIRFRHHLLQLLHRQILPQLMTNLLQIIQRHIPGPFYIERIERLFYFLRGILRHLYNENSEKAKMKPSYSPWFAEIRWNQSWFNHFYVSWGCRAGLSVWRFLLFLVRCRGLLVQPLNLKCRLFLEKGEENEVSCKPEPSVSNSSNALLISAFYSCSSSILYWLCYFYF